VSDYSLKLTIRNGRILQAIKDAGFDSQAAFCKANDLCYQAFIDMVGLRRSPVGKNGG
jgi:hypothetical protein